MDEVVETPAAAAAQRGLDARGLRGLARAALLALPALLVACAVLWPLRHKAFTIDDTFFLQTARHALSDPLHPSAFETVWSEARVPLRASRIAPTGPVIAWLLLPSAARGGAEWAAHAMELVCLLTAVLATVLLGLRLGLARRAAAGAGLLLATTPAALAMAGTAMPDVPAMAFGALGLERLLACAAACKSHTGRFAQAHTALAAALLLGLAWATRTNAALLLPIGAALCAAATLDTSGEVLAAWPDPLSTRRLPRPVWFALGGAVLLFFSLLTVTRDPRSEGVPLATAMATLVSVRRLPSNLLAFPMHWVFSLPLALPWLWLHGRRVLARRRVLAGAALVMVAMVLIDEWWPRLDVALFATLGAAVLADILLDGWERQDRLQLALGAWIASPLLLCVYQHLPPKYLLASAPGAVLLLARELSARSRREGAAVLLATALFGTVLGVLILRADAAFAELGRRAAAELIAPHTARGERVWFAGHWGFQWYAEKAGARVLTTTPPHAQPGELVVSSLRSKGDAIELVPRRSELARLTDETPQGRIMDRSLCAGFYAGWWGYYPWWWGPGPLDTFTLWRVEP